MSQHGTTALAALFSFGLAVPLVRAQGGQEKDRPAVNDVQPPPRTNDAADPFAGIATAPQTGQDQPQPRATWVQRLFGRNFGFREELFSQFDTSDDASVASRQSLGFEVLKKFSSSTQTFASINFQGRLVRRDGYHPVLNDMEGAGRPGWWFEYHNLYIDLYNIFNPLMSGAARREHLGRFNFRAGHFYVPFGLNLQTDTHGTILQLSNERNFGFERDWYAGFWGGLNRHLNYHVYYLTGSGYRLQYKGQSGLGAARLSLANHFNSDHAIEGGISLLGGERLDTSMNALTPKPIGTKRVGVDGRYRTAAPRGTLTLLGEVSGGSDQSRTLFTGLYQTDYLHASRRWGLAAQYRRFTQQQAGVDSSIIGEFTWYLSNDVSGSHLHWVKLNVERQLQRMHGPPATVFTLQYYLYR